MNRLTDNKIVLVTRPTRLAELVIRFNTVSQARFYVEHQGADFSDYIREDETYHRALSGAEEILGQLGRVQIVDRGFLPNFVFASEDTVVTLGQDGLVANTLKYLHGQPVVGVNPDPERWNGSLLPFRVGDLAKLMPEVISRKRSTHSVTMAKAALNNGQTMYAVNDIFIGPKTHTSARYVIRHGKVGETHSSSGVIVSTGMGATGWLKSLLTGAGAIASVAGNRGKNEPVDCYRPPVDSSEDVIHFLDPRNSFERDPGIEQALKIDFVRVFLQEENVLAHDEPPDRVIDRRILVVALIDRELQKMIWQRLHRLICLAERLHAFSFS